MKETVAIVVLCAVLVLAYAGSRGNGRPAEVQCPTLDQLLLEKAAKEKQERAERARDRREKLVDELHKWIDP